MSDTAIRDGIVDAYHRAVNTGMLEMIFREQVAPVVAEAMVNARNEQLQRDLAAMTAERDGYRKSYDGAAESCAAFKQQRDELKASLHDANNRYLEHVHDLTVELKRQRNRRIAWADHPQCPRCGTRLKQTEDLCGAWKCDKHEDDGKCLWWDWELTMIIMGELERERTMRLNAQTALGEAIRAIFGRTAPRFEPDETGKKVVFSEGFYTMEDFASWTAARDAGKSTTP